MSDSKEQLHSAITAKAELDRTVSRLIIEDVSAVMARNLSTILAAIEGLRDEVRAGAVESATRLKKLEARMDASEKDSAELRHMFETYIAGNRRAELDSLRRDVDDLKRGDGNG